MSERFARGSLARLYLDLIVTGVGSVGQTPTIAIQRKKDGYWLNAGTGLFAAGFIANAMTALDAANMPGRYYFDFDHAKDLLVTPDFVAKLLNAGAPAALVYQEVSFGPLPAVALPSMCSIQGSVIGLDGKVLPGERVRATLVPVLKDGLGRGYQADTPIATFTDVNGAFDLPVVRGATVRLEIAAIGYDRKFVVPNLASVLFTAL